MGDQFLFICILYVQFLFTCKIPAAENDVHHYSTINFDTMLTGVGVDH